MSVSPKKKNWCFQMEVKSYGFVLEKAGDGSFISTVILQARTVFFTTPCDSTLLNIAYIRNFQRGVSKVIKQKDVIRKVTCVK